MITFSELIKEDKLEEDVSKLISSATGKAKEKFKEDPSLILTIVGVSAAVINGIRTYFKNNLRGGKIVYFDGTEGERTVIFQVRLGRNRGHIKLVLEPRRFAFYTDNPRLANKIGRKGLIRITSQILKVTGHYDFNDVQLGRDPGNVTIPVKSFE